MKVRLLALLFALSLAFGLPIAASAGPATGSDTDGDGVLDPFDNCTDEPNAGQQDGNHDGCGDACTQEIECDANGDTVVGVSDFTILSNEFSNDCNVNPGLTCAADCNGDDVVGVSDFTILSNEFGNKVGDSGITTAQCDKTICRCDL